MEDFDVHVLGIAILHLTNHGYTEDMDIKVLHSMWPEDIGTDVGKKFNIEKPGKDQDMLEEIIMMESTIVDFKRLMELTNYTDKGSSQLSHLLKHLEYSSDNLSKQRHEVELRKLQIPEELRFEEETYGEFHT
ncbi:hypothetical protein K1719_010835 [Acacia pycnantha]|nr:hypothetical protein K1719_010835 [Acacia pycnantha]